MLAIIKKSIKCALPCLTAMLISVSSTKAAVLVLQDGLIPTIDGTPTGGVYSGTQDASIKSNAADSIHNNDSLDIDGTSGGVSTEASLLKFADLSLVSGLTVIDAQLTLYVYDTGANPTLLRLADSATWDEGVVTYNNLGTLNDGISATDTASSTATFSANATGFVTIDVTSDLQAWVNGSAINNGWGFLDNGTAGVGIRSSEYATIAQRPMLTITTATVPEPGSALLCGMAGLMLLLRRKRCS